MYSNYPLKSHLVIPHILFVLTLVSCGKEVVDEEYTAGLQKPEAETTLTFENLPVIDGSDSTEPLRSLLVAKELGVDLGWNKDPVDMVWRFMAEEDNKEWYGIWGLQSGGKQGSLKMSGTHDSFLGLIRGESDLIITARSISRDEKKYADEEGVELLSCPIAKDAFVFIVNEANPVKNLTIEQVQKIYMGEIINWEEVGGDNAPITPYVRNANSGSQEKMETMVMKGLTMPDWSVLTLWAMLTPYTKLARDTFGICYTPYYYYKYMARNEKIVAISLNGVSPNRETIEDGLYPFVTEVFASVRSDIDKSSTAYQLFYQLSTGKKDDVIEESGYVCYN